MKRPLFIDRRKAGLRIRDVFFAQPGGPVSATNADICYFLQAPMPGANAEVFFTSLIDLTRDEAELLDGINKGFRYEIRRARDKDGLKANVDRPDAAMLDRLFDYYDTFAASKGLAGANRTKLAALQAAGGLMLGWVPDLRDGAGPTAPWLSVHVYIADGERTRLYHSASLASLPNGDRQLIGRANKLLHWEALRYFKAQGYRTYDMGGLSMGEALKAIDDFKQSFGGEVVKEFNHIEANSMKGRLALWAWRLKARLAAYRPAPGSL